MKLVTVSVVLGHSSLWRLPLTEASLFYVWPCSHYCPLFDKGIG